MDPAPVLHAHPPPWLARVGRWLRRRPGRTAGDPGTAADTASAAPTESTFGASLFGLAEAPDDPDVAGGRAGYLEWLLAAPAGPPRPDPLAPALILEALDRELGSRDGCARLLRRAPNVVPRLLETLRSETYATFELARHIEKDAVLTAEVMLRARSCLYAQSSRRRPTVAHAVDLLGSAGLNEVIARVLFRPMFNAPAGSRASTAGNRMMEDAYRCAVLMVAHAEGVGADPVDAHLAGLLQCAGWGAVLRALEIHRLLDRLHAGALEDEDFVTELFDRRDRMLAQLLSVWQVSPALQALAAALAGRPGPMPLLQALRSVQAQVIAARLRNLASERAS